MKPDVAARINDLNCRFYEDFGASFASTRRKVNPGIARILARLPREGLLVDLGCGSAALISELAVRGVKGAYLGLDFSRPELDIAAAEADKVRHPGLTVSFRQANLMRDTWADLIERNSVDMVLAFAFLHHIPGKEHRTRILAAANGILKPGGLFLLSVWQFQHSPGLWSRRQPWELAGIDAAEVDQNDYLLDWRHGVTAGQGGGLRYVHLFSQEELSRLAAESGFEIIDTFASDGKGGRLGLYQVWRKADERRGGNGTKG